MQNHPHSLLLKHFNILAFKYEKKTDFLEISHLVVDSSRKCWYKDYLVVRSIYFASKLEKRLNPLVPDVH